MTKGEEKAVQAERATTKAWRIRLPKDATPEERRCVELRRKGVSLMGIEEEIFGKSTRGKWAWRTLHRIGFSSSKAGQL